jgi:hypothetical protein
MSERPWTAILSSSYNHITVVNVIASIDSPKARVQIENSYSSYSLIALVPGTHASSVITFRDGPNVDSAVPVHPSCPNRIDPFDTSHITALMAQPESD